MRLEAYVGLFAGVAVACVLTGSAAGAEVLAKENAAAKSDPGFAPAGYRLVWSDEFNGAKLDQQKWQYRTGSRLWSVQKPENVSVGDGLLKLHLKREESGGLHYTAGGVISRQRFKYGYYEARFRVPPGKGWHTSFWMMNYGGVKASGGTDQQMTLGARQEIDVCENDSIDLASYSVNLHQWFPLHKTSGHKRVKTPDLSVDFHVWGCEFSAAECLFFIDGQLVQRVDVTSFPHGEQNVWLTSVAAGLGRTDRVDDSRLPATAEFDWVRVYAK